MKKCQSICDIDDWCMCEAVQSLETKIEEDIKDRALKDKKNYFSFLNEIINNYIFRHLFKMSEKYIIQYMVNIHLEMP